MLQDDETICHACETKLEKRRPTAETFEVQRPPPTVRGETGRLTRPAQHGTLLHRFDHKLDEFRDRLFSLAPLVCLVVVASYLLGQHTMRTDVRTFFLDDKYYGLILTQLHINPAAYYSISIFLYHQLYAPTLAIIHFPLIFYIWMLVPSLQDIKWLYLVFALAGTTASYFTVVTITKRSLVAFLSAAWIAYFLETTAYLMFEHWAVIVFLIGLAFFVSERHIPAAATIAVAALIKEVFTPFILIASVYYVTQIILLYVRMRIGAKGFYGRERKESRTLIAKRGAVWCVATGVVGVAYYLNGVASSGAELPVYFFRTFDLSILSLLFAGSWFRYPPLPLILTVGLALVGMGTLPNWNQRIIVYTSFASMILLMLTARGGGLISSWQEIAQSSPRYVAMSITLINIFWLVGLYKITEYPMRWFTSLRR